MADKIRTLQEQLGKIIKGKKEVTDKIIMAILAGGHVLLEDVPGVGKTTTAQFLEYLSKREKDIQEIQAIGLDGFHFHQDYILTHEACVDGKMVPMKEVKGCPETFDIEKLKRKLAELKDGTTKWPIYDRKIHDVVEDALNRCLDHNVTDWGKIKTSIKDDLGEFLWKRTKRNPMILPIITEV